MSMKSIGPARRSCSRPGRSGIPSTGGTSGALSPAAPPPPGALTGGASRSAGGCAARAMPPARMTAPRSRRTSGDAGVGIALAGEHVAQGRGVPLVDPQQHHEQQAHPHRLDPEEHGDAGRDRGDANQQEADVLTEPRAQGEHHLLARAILGAERLRHARAPQQADQLDRAGEELRRLLRRTRNRKSTRLNSSHGYISYAVFCLKKKKKKKKQT